MHQTVSQHTTKTRLLRLGGTSLVTMLAVMAGGCQSYERSPLELPRHQEAFLARSPESPEVRVFAASLNPGEETHAVFDPSDGISCAEAEVLATVFNAELRLSRLRAGVTLATAENAGLWEDPTIGVDLTRIIQSTPEPWKVFTTVGMTIPISGRLEIEKQRAGVEHAAELARVARREWAIRMEVRRAWTGWSALDAQLSTTREFLGNVEKVVFIVNKVEEAGEISRSEARLFRIEKATTAADLAVLESRVREAELRLRQLMGMSPDAPLRFQPNGVGPSRLGSHAIVSDSISSSMLEQRNLDMLVAAAEYEVAEKTLELEVRKQYPDLQIGPGYGNEDGLDQVLLGLSMPIPILNGNRQRIAEARARREVARASAETTLEHLLAGLRASEVRRDAATLRRQTFESEIVPLVDAQYADMRQVAKLGELNTLVLLESLTRQQEAKITLVDARRDESLAMIDIDELLGPDLPNGQSPASTAEPALPNTQMTKPKAIINDR